MQRGRSPEVYVLVVVQGVVNLLKTRRTLGGPWNREAHPHGFVLLDVGVLPHDHYLQDAVVSLLERVENQVFGRVALSSSVLALHISEKPRKGC